MLDRLVRLFTSLRLTVVLLALGGILVFWGTLAQVDLGLYKAQNEFFRSFFVFWHPGDGTMRIPIFPGGYLIGGLLLINLFSAHLRYYKVGWKKLGIAMIHLGIVLLLLGQFATDMLSQESAMHIRNGETRNYSEAARTWELAVIEDSTNVVEKVVAIPDKMLSNGKEVTDPEMPFTVRVKSYFMNSALSETNRTGFAQVGTTGGIGGDLFWAELPRVTDMDSRDMPSGIVDINTPQGSLGTLLISSYLSHPQHLTFNGKQYELALRPMRFYKPFSIHLIKFTHDQYMGTDIPKNFSSRIRLMRPDTGENREVLIYMNSPLRYDGETFYQASFDTDDQGTILEVVHNPSWLTPYLACIMVAFGLIYQFLSHLTKFIKRKSA